MTSAPDLTLHAVSRMAQRGVSTNDLELITWIGTEVEGGYLVRRKDFQSLDRELRRLRDQARRLVGKRIVINDAHVVTVYHAGRTKERRLLRTAEDASLGEYTK